MPLQATGETSRLNLFSITLVAVTLFLNFENLTVVDIFGDMTTQQVVIPLGLK